MRNKAAKVSDPNTFYTEPGSPIVDVYDAKVLPDGKFEVVVTGKKNIQDEIESFRNQTDMSYILKQLAIGNNEVLTQTIGQYGDFTKMPTNMAEALQMDIDAKKAFYSLDLDTRNKFDNDYHHWLVSLGSEEWIAKMPFKKDEASSDVKPVSESEN